MLWKVFRVSKPFFAQTCLWKHRVHQLFVFRACICLLFEISLRVNFDLVFSIWIGCVFVGQVDQDLVFIVLQAELFWLNKLGGRQLWVVANWIIVLVRCTRCKAWWSDLLENGHSILDVACCLFISRQRIFGARISAPMDLGLQLLQGQSSRFSSLSLECIIVGIALVVMLLQVFFPFLAHKGRYIQVVDVFVLSNHIFELPMLDRLLLLLLLIGRCFVITHNKSLGFHTCDTCHCLLSLRDVTS